MIHQISLTAHPRTPYQIGVDAIAGMDLHYRNLSDEQKREITLLYLDHIDDIGMDIGQAITKCEPCISRDIETKHDNHDEGKHE